MARTGDLGALPEAELLEQLWQGGDQLPQTAPVTATRTDDRSIALRCSTPGAQIAYRILPQDTARMGWRIYTAPVTLAGGERLEAEALRIGYSASEVLTQR